MVLWNVLFLNVWYIDLAFSKPTNIVEKMWKLRHVDRKVLRTFSMHLSLKSLQEMTELGWIDVTLLTANLLRIAMNTSEKAIIYDKVSLRHVTNQNICGNEDKVI